MILSVIIVNYRVPYFLELCLHSVRKALEGLEAEIIVVDNHSADNSLDLLRPLFPEVNWIANPDNIGFARANNQALNRSTGDYLLFLNPDTILPEDFARKCLAFILSVSPSPDPANPANPCPGPDPASPCPPPDPANPSPRPPGALGVRMIDGNGQFLKESRRGFPSPWVAFCKLSGLTTLMPHSRHFARYYLGHLPAARPHPAPVLSGACFWVSRSALEKTGAFDENFFMYAEDIDLSYRLEKAGYANYYYPGTTIIHFKGESTPKDIRYIRQFYKAMIQFHLKHFNPSAITRTAIGTAIRLRAALSAAANIRIPPASRPRRAWLTGDQEGIDRLRPALTASTALAALPPRTPAPDENHADEIIYCIGKEFSFKSAIHALEAKSRDKTAAFYAAGCHAVLGSSRRDRKGEIWIL